MFFHHVVLFYFIVIHQARQIFLRTTMFVESYMSKRAPRDHTFD